MILQTRAPFSWRAEVAATRNAKGGRMSAQDFVIRTMTRAEVDLAVDWAAREGWNPGLHDAGCFHAADPEGFLVGLLDGKPAATLSAVRYGAGLGFLGFFIVAPEHRGKSLGIQIWNAGLERLAGRVIGLDSVLAQEATYQKTGFALAWRNARCMGKTGPVGSAGPLPPEVVDLASLPFELVEAYDRPLFACGRKAFLRCWVAMPQSRALGVVRGGRLAGYGVIRRCGVGHKIGPLFADGPHEAEELFQALVAGLDPGETFFLDTPAANPEAVALAGRHKLETVFETARMYKGPAPAMPMGRVFGITSFELG